MYGAWSVAGLGGRPVGTQAARSVTTGEREGSDETRTDRRRRTERLLRRREPSGEGRRGGRLRARQHPALLAGGRRRDKATPRRGHQTTTSTLAPTSPNPDYRDSWPAHCVAGTDGAAFHPNLDPQPFGAVFDKGEHTAAYSGFEGKTGDGTALADWLRTHGITEVDVAGIATDHCVRATALDAVRLGFATRVLLSLTAGVAASTTEDAIRAMRAAGCELVGDPIVREEGPPPVTL